MEVGRWGNPAANWDGKSGRYTYIKETGSHLPIRTFLPLSLSVVFRSSTRNLRSRNCSRKENTASPYKKKTIGLERERDVEFGVLDFPVLLV